MMKNEEKSDFFAENERFKPLIAFYARRLKSDTAAADLWAFLWELLTYKKPPNDRYVAVCLRNEYIRMSRAETKENNAPLYSVAFFDRPLEIMIDIGRAFKKITQKQEEVLRLHYSGGYSISDISKLTGVSRQAVNQNRKKGLLKLRDILGEKYLN